MGGAALVIFAIMVGDAMSSPYTVPAVAIPAYLSIHVLLSLVAGPKRVPVKSMSLIFMPAIAGEDERRQHHEWTILTQMMTHADDMLLAGTMSPVECEAIWGQAYDRLEDTTHV